MKQILLENVSKSFGDKTVLRNVSLVLEEGRCYALTGPSGSGKTTLMRLLAGLDRPDSGSLHTEPDKLTVSYAFQEPRLFPGLSLQSNIQLVDPERDVAELLDLLDLGKEADSMPATLSGGMQKRAALARALSKEADVYLLDEPTGGQDAAHIKSVVSAIRQYTKGSIVITATHESSIIPVIADFRLNLADGSIESVAIPAK